MPDVLKTSLPKKVEQEERGSSAESTPVPPSKVCSNFYTRKAVTFADETCAEGQGDEGQRHGRLQNQGKACTRQDIGQVSQHFRVALQQC